MPLAWLRAQPAMSAPIASARNGAQLASVLRGAEITLTTEELAQLDAASA